MRKLHLLKSGKTETDKLFDRAARKYLRKNIDFVVGNIVNEWCILGLGEFIDNEEVYDIASKLIVKMFPTQGYAFELDVDGYSLTQKNKEDIFLKFKSGIERIIEERNEQYDEYLKRLENCRHLNMSHIEFACYNESGFVKLLNSAGMTLGIEITTNAGGNVVKHHIPIRIVRQYCKSCADSVSNWIYFAVTNCSDPSPIGFDKIRKSVGETILRLFPVQMGESIMEQGWNPQELSQHVKNEIFRKFIIASFKEIYGN
jgi:hypothetical protein